MPEAQNNFSENTEESIGKLHSALKNACDERKDEIESLFDESTQYEKKEKLVAKIAFNKLIQTGRLIESNQKAIQEAVKEAIKDFS